MSKFVIAAFAMSCAAVLGALGQIAFKKANVQFNGSLFTNYVLFGGLFLYGVALIINLWAYRFGNASSLYSFIALSYIFVALLAAWLLAEPLTWQKGVGACVILLGVTLMNV